MTEPPVPTPDESLVRDRPVPAGETTVIDRRPDATPFLLLPVRIETRFADGPDGAGPDREGGGELWVRIYPDQVMVDGHHPALTPAELSDGNSYWDALWRAGNPPPLQDAAAAPWRGLVARYGSARAAWIVRQTTPVNLAGRPAQPTPDGQDPVPAPQPPNPATSSDSWQSPSVAALLPPAWTVVLDSAGTTSSHTGSPVTPALALSLSPADPSSAGGFADGMPVDPGMRWLVDFDAAVSAGMALRIPLTAQQRQTGFDRVLVYGVSAADQTAVDSGTDSESDSEPNGAGASQFAALLDAHHYSDGLSFVPQGAPTNNTSDASSAYSRKDPAAQISFAVELGAPLTAQADADGPLAASLLGVPVATFDHVRYADRHDQRDGADMLTALWPATLGYFLRQMGDGTLGEARIEQARQWVIAHVRPRGPLPALRTGTVPYGVLPVTSTSLWSPDTTDPVESAVFQMVERLLPVWDASSADAPHAGATPGDPDADMAHVLGMDASSMSFRGRQLFGDQLLWNLMAFEAVPAAGRDAWWQQHLQPGRAQLDGLGYGSWDPRLIHLGLTPTDFPVSAPTVVDGPLSETDPLPADADFGGVKVDYITWLRSAAIADIRADNYPGPAVPDTLLYKILRQSMLLDYVTLAQFAQVRIGELDIAQTREQELVGIAAGSAAPAAQRYAAAPATPATPATEDAAQVTPWDVLARPVSATELTTWAEYLVALQPQPESPFARLADLRACMDRLATLPTAELDRLLTETLDTCSHRLDVWATSLATARLTRQRAAQQAPGLRIGAYSFVADLRPAPARDPVDTATARLVADLDTHRAALYPTSPTPTAALQAPADNGGFIHAPSMTQAATAAVLRSGYLSHQGGPEDGLLALDLSSDRVRSALYLLDGVRQGQPLGALLGYQLESAMHDAALDPYIQPLRDLFPLVAGKLTATSPTDEIAGAGDVVDALALDRARGDGTLAPAAAWPAGLPAPGADRDRLLALFAVLDDTVDAISDLGVAEAVYQTMRGNPDRIGGTLDGVSQAQRTPEPQIVDTPRSGADHTQRVVALFAGAPARPAAWVGVPATARAIAEPWLDAWAAALLPDPTTIEAKVTYTAGAAAPATVTVRLSDLGIGPLDVLALCRITAQAQRSELDERLLYHAAPSGATDLAIDYTAAAPSVTFTDLFNIAQAVDDLIAGARPLAASDFSPPPASVPAGIDTAELNARAEATPPPRGAAGTPHAPPAGGSGTADDARDAILAASFYGLAGAVPTSPRGSGPDPGLAAQAASLHDALATRSAAVTAVMPDPSDPAPALSLFDAAFAKSLLVLPRFTPPDAAALRAAFTQDPATIGATPAAVERWQQQLTHVRAGVSRLDLALLTAELLSGATPPPLRIAQLPAAAPDQWLALPPAPGSTRANGRLAVMALVSGDLADAAASWSGLHIDAWPERVPSTRESAGVAFHHDDPKARAPQCLLLAVCPDETRGWNDAVLAQVLRETMTLARIRTVDLASVGPVGQLLPALLFPFNLRQDTVSLTMVRVESAAAPVLLQQNPKTGKD
jgi:hypothetical protein